MITLTDAAANHIKHMLTKQQGSIGFRLSIKKTGCSGYAYVPAIVKEETAGDIKIAAQDQLFIFVDPKSEVFLKDLVIDFISEAVGTGLKQKRLVFINPNEKNRCGCGESFTVE